jgi:flagellar motor protein MotB
MIGLLGVYAALFVVLTTVQFYKPPSERQQTAASLEEAAIAALPAYEHTEDDLFAEDEAAAPVAFENTVVVNNTAINLSAEYEPLYFSPDGDGRNDQLYITLSVSGVDAISSWNFEILQPSLAGNSSVFKRFSGTGIPSERVVWNGRSDRGELVQAATDYPYIYTITDANGNKSPPLNGQIHVDVFVMRRSDGRLQIQVPSIIFRTNAADFTGLTRDVVSNNSLVIQRIATILNRYPDYQVQVEGHANPENAPGSTARITEERFESRAGSVSENRALAIVRFLVTNGVAETRLTAVGMGISTPIVTFEDRENWWQNRRVEFFLKRED